MRSWDIRTLPWLPAGGGFPTIACCMVGECLKGVKKWFTESVAQCDPTCSEPAEPEAFGALLPKSGPRQAWN